MTPAPPAYPILYTGRNDAAPRPCPVMDWGSASVGRRDGSSVRGLVQMPMWSVARRGGWSSGGGVEFRFGSGTEDGRGGEGGDEGLGPGTRASETLSPSSLLWWVVLPLLDVAG
jgi:hypothetical protein